MGCNGVCPMGFTPPMISDDRAGDRLGEVLVSLVRKGLHEQERLCLRLQGDSMWPTISPGSLVEIEHISPHDVRLGDIVVWQQGEELIAHRVVQKVRSGSGILLVTKGDNRPGSDQLLSQRAVLGRIAGHYGPNDLKLERDSWRGRLAAAFWVSRWRLRSFLDEFGRLLPRRFQWPLIRFRNYLGHYLSLGFRVAFLR